MATTQQAYDETGKVVFDDYYVQPDPRPYFTSELRDLEYQIAGKAEPIFRETIASLRDELERDAIDVVDLGSSYGINAALLTTDLSMDDLYAHYNDPAVSDLSRDELLERDRRYYDAHRTDEQIDFTGMDSSAPAIQYAEDAGLIESGISRNLEEERLDPVERESLRGTDLVISTGAVGYVTERTIGQVLDAAGEQQPWMAHCVLRMFAFDPCEEMLRERGYEVEQLDGTLRQRRFATEEERAHVLENLESIGVDPTGKETDGWYHANVYIARPVAAMG